MFLKYPHYDEYTVDFLILSWPTENYNFTFIFGAICTPGTGPKPVFSEVIRNAAVFK